MNNTLALLFFLLSTGLLLAQNTYNMGDVDMTTDCEGFFYDDGGPFTQNSPFGFYAIQSGADTQTFTICSEGAECMVMDFQSFVTENSSNLGLGDVLHVYDGADTSAPLIGSYSGGLVFNENPYGRITAGSGCMTFLFDENGGFSTFGWEAEWACYTQSCATVNDLKPPVDCADAIVVCGDETLTPNGAIGISDISFEGGSNGCLTSEEKSPTWIEINIHAFAPVNTPLTFTIVPLPGAEDYDFAIYGPDSDCNNLEVPIRCSYAEEVTSGTLSTGLKAGETDTSESPVVDNEGNASNGFLAPLIVNPGERYYILVNNFSLNGVGFDIVWGDEVFDNNLLNCSVCDHLVLMPDDFEVCLGQTFEIDPIVHGGSGFLSYQWTASVPDVSLEGFNPLTATPPPGFMGEITFTGAVTDTEASYCTKEASITVHVTSSSDSTPYEFTGASIDSVACIGESVVMTLEGDFGVNSMVSWDFDMGNLMEGDANSLGPLSVNWNTAGNKTITATVENPDFGDCPPFVYEFETEILPSVSHPVVFCSSDTLSNTFTWSEVEEAVSYNVSVSVNGNAPFTLNTTENEFVLESPVDGDVVELTVSSVAGDGYCNTEESNSIECTISGCSPEVELEIVNLASFYCQSQAAVELIAQPSGGTISIMGAEVTVLDPSSFTSGLQTIKYEYTIPETGCMLEHSQQFIIGENFNTPSVQCEAVSYSEVTFSWNDVGAESYTLEIAVNGQNPTTTIVLNNFYTVENLNPNDIVSLSIVEMSPLSCFNGVESTQICQSLDCPDVEISTNIMEVYCEEDDFILLEATPVGGDFFGMYVVNDDASYYVFPFETGSFTITYLYTDSETNCSYSIEENVEIIPTLEEPTIECMETIDNEIRFDWEAVNGASAYQLLLYVNGDLLLQNTTTDTSYVAANLSFGDEVELGVAAFDSSGESCESNFTSTTCFAQNCPVVAVSIENLEDSYCSNASDFILLGNPSGGTFFIDGEEIPLAQIDPSSIDAGVHTISYTYLDAITNCDYTTEQNIEILVFPATPSPTCSAVSTSEITFGWNVIEGADRYDIGYTVNGGTSINESLNGDVSTFTVAGLNPDDVVRLSIQAVSNACGGSEVAISECVSEDCPPITPFITGLDQEFYCLDEPAIELTATPIGGIFTINGMESDFFVPSAIGTGEVEVVYTYLYEGCTYFDVLNLEVIGLVLEPVVTCLESFDEISFQWSTDEFASIYVLSYSVNGGFEQEVTLAGTDSSFTVTGLSPNDQVTFNISAIGMCGESSVTTTTCSTNDCPTIEITFENFADSYCKNDGIVELSASPLGGIFSLEGNIVENAINPIDLEVGNYSLTYEYTDAESNCTYSQSINFAIEDVPARPVIACGTSSVDCVSFEWTDLENADEYEISVVVNGDVVVSELLTETGYTICGLEQGDEVILGVEGRNQCGEGAGDIQNCSHECSAIQPIITNLEAAYCEDADAILLEGQPLGGSFSLSDGTAITDWNPVLYEAGVYTILYDFTDSDGCEYQTSNNVEIFPLPTANFTASDTTVLESEGITLLADIQSGATYIWYVNGNIVASNVVYTFTSENAGMYQITLEVLSNDGCSATSETFEVTVEMDTAIEAHPFFETLQIHPNPTTDLLQLSLNTTISTAAILQWYNAQGKLVAAENLQIGQNGWNHSVDVASFEAGVYYLYLQTDVGLAVEKVLIVK